MKRKFVLGIMLFGVLFSSLYAGEQEPSQLGGTVLLDQLNKQVMSVKVDGQDDDDDEVRPVVDPTQMDIQPGEAALEGAEDFEFSEDDLEPAMSEFEETGSSESEELSGEEMSEYFADVAFNDDDAVGL